MDWNLIWTINNKLLLEASVKQASRMPLGDFDGTQMTYTIYNIIIKFLLSYT